MDYCRIAIYIFAAYFSIAHGSLPCPVSAKDPGCKGASHNDLEMIGSSAVFLFCDRF